MNCLPLRRQREDSILAFVATNATTASTGKTYIFCLALQRMMYSFDLLLMKLVSTAFKYNIEQNAHTMKCDLYLRFWHKYLC